MMTKAPLEFDFMGCLVTRSDLDLVTGGSGYQGKLLPFSITPALILINLDQISQSQLKTKVLFAF